MRICPDGRGVDRHLAGLRFAPKTPETNRRAMAAPPDFHLPDVADIPLYDSIPIKDQGRHGSCTGQAQSILKAALWLKKTGKLEIYSASFSYDMTRIEEGTPLTEDSGCAIPDVMRGDVQRGICREELWPSSSDAIYTSEPTAEAKADAMAARLALYYHCPNNFTIRASIAQGFGVTIGISVFENMMSAHAAKFGEVLYPEPGEKVLGGHDVVIRGYDMHRKIGGEVGAYDLHNSWSLAWGLRGRFWLPMRYVDDQLATDAESPRGIRI